MGLGRRAAANSGLKASEYATHMLGLIFLRYAESRFAGFIEVPSEALRSLFIE